MNAHLRAKVHIDRSNLGFSYATSLGPMCGGWLWEDDGDSVIVHPTQQWTKINGKNPHAVLPFRGTRYSLVAFTHKAAFVKGADHIRRQACGDGFRVPWKAPPELSHKGGYGGDDTHWKACGKYVYICETVVVSLTTDTLSGLQDKILRELVDSQLPNETTMKLNKNAAPA